MRFSVVFYTSYKQISKYGKAAFLSINYIRTVPSFYVAYPQLLTVSLRKPWKRHKEARWLNRAVLSSDITSEGRQYLDIPVPVTTIFMKPMLPEYLCLPSSFPQNLPSMVSCGKSALFLTYCPASSFCWYLMNCVYMYTVAAPNTKYYLSYYYYYSLLQLSFRSVAAVLTLVTNKNKYT
jgi:hypothetical protein